MNHRDQVETVPPGFEVLAGTETCAIAAMAHRERPLVSVQFHPEVVHTAHRRPDPVEFRFRRLRMQAGLEPQRSYRPN